MARNKLRGNTVVKKNEMMLKRYPWLYAAREVWTLSTDIIQEYPLIINVKNTEGFLDRNLFSLFPRDIRGVEIWLYLERIKTQSRAVISSTLKSDKTIQQILDEAGLKSHYLKAGYKLVNVAKIVDYGNYGPITIYRFNKPLSIRNFGNLT